MIYNKKKYLVYNNILLIKYIVYEKLYIWLKRKVSVKISCMRSIFKAHFRLGSLFEVQITRFAKKRVLYKLEQTRVDQRRRLTE